MTTLTCPYCGAEMEEGYLCTHKYPIWTKTGTPVFRIPKDAVRLRPPDDNTEDNTSFPRHEFPRAMLCRACKAIVFQYN